MAYVNYIREITRFIGFASDAGLSGNERSFWYALMAIANERANGSDWPEDFMSINNKTLLAKVPFSANKLPEIRNKLKQAGLIDFKPGRRNELAAKYMILYFYPELSTGNAHNVESYHRNGDKNGNKDGYKTGNKDGYKTGNKDGYKTGNKDGNFNVNLNGTPNSNMCEDDVDADADMAAYRAMRGCVSRAFRDEIGRDAQPAELRLISMTALNLGMEQELAVQAIGRAAARGAKSPAAYAAEIMGTWDYRGVHTVFEMINSESLIKV